MRGFLWLTTESSLGWAGSQCWDPRRRRRQCCPETAPSGCCPLLTTEGRNRTEQNQAKMHTEARETFSCKALPTGKWSLEGRRASRDLRACDSLSTFPVGLWAEVAFIIIQIMAVTMPQIPNLPQLWQGMHNNVLRRNLIDIKNSVLLWLRC